LSIIRAENLTFGYPGQCRAALEDLSFSVKEGEVVLLLGPSGCGKSTLALTLNGLIPHVIEGELQGEVWVAGLNTKEHPVSVLAQRVGMVFQDPDSQFSMLTVEEEVAFGLENLGAPPESMGPRIEAALQKVGLEKERKTRLDRLSGGMKQRLALASVLAMEPPILVLDEPTSNLDPRGTRDFFAVLATLRRTKTVLIIEHKLDELIHLVDRVLVMGPGGRFIAQGRPRALFKKSSRLLSENGIWVPQVTQLADVLMERGMQVEPYPLTVEDAEKALLRLNPHHQTVATPVVREEKEPAIQVRGLSFTYPNGTQALKDVRLTVSEEDFVALVGPNGSGKTTLAHHLMGILPQSPGSVFILGHDVSQIGTRELTDLAGYVFQNPEHQFVTESVYDELAFSLRTRGVAEEEIEGRVEGMLRDFSLEGYLESNPFSLSQGEKRRLSVATMLIVGQRVLILDEPTFGQDRASAQRLMAHISALNSRGVTILMITHDMRLMAEYARKVVVLVEGSTVFQGPVKELLADECLLEKAGLAVPPLYSLSSRLAKVYPDLQGAMSQEAFLRAYGLGPMLEV
jgi:energy-coupling factor transporter ATP-binding protein EcfA2